MELSCDFSAVCLNVSYTAWTQFRVFPQKRRVYICNQRRYRLWWNKEAWIMMRRYSSAQSLSWLGWFFFWYPFRQCVLQEMVFMHTQRAPRWHGICLCLVLVGAKNHFPTPAVLSWPHRERCGSVCFGSFAVFNSFVSFQTDYQRRTHTPVGLFLASEFNSVLHFPTTGSLNFCIPDKCHENPLLVEFDVSPRFECFFLSHEIGDVSLISDLVFQNFQVLGDTECKSYVSNEPPIHFIVFGSPRFQGATQNIWSQTWAVMKSGNEPWAIACVPTMFPRV